MSDAPPSGVPRGFLAIACILRPQGRRGEVLAEVLSDIPARFENLRRAFLDQSAAPPAPVTVEHTWPHKHKVVLKLAGVDSIDAAARLKGRYLLIPREEKMALPAGQYYLWELEGCRVVAREGERERELGTVTEVERTGGVDLLRVSDASREILIPLARSICKRIDPAGKVIEVDPPEDLLDLNVR